MPRSAPVPRCLFALLAAGSAVLGCSGGGESSTGGAPDAAPTYYRDVKPIVDAKCGACHVAGGIAPFALTTYDEVRQQGAAIEAAVNAGTMPPWPPARTCDTFDGDRSLSADQIATIGKWVDGGAAAGDPSDTPEETGDGEPTLTRTDVTLKMPVAYTPQLSPDDYRCFLIDWPGTTTSYVTGTGVAPGAPSMVHHVIVYMASADQAASFQALDDADPGPGWGCFGGPGSSLGAVHPAWLGAWTPGAVGADFPAGTGIEVPPGAKLIVQVHYNTSAVKPSPDQTSLLFKVDPTVEKKAVIIPFSNPDWVMNKSMDIPAHAMDVSHAFATDPTPLMGVLSQGVIPAGAPFTVYAAGLHMHTRGTRAVASIVRGGGDGGADECLLAIDHWNFHWQGTYRFAEPKTFHPGDKLSVECHWDNPTAMDMNWGEGTGDEMCLGTFYATP